MIVKTDFVTNSSSTIYIVYVPKKYPFTTNKMVNEFNEQKKYYCEEDWEPYNTVHQIKNIFDGILDRLKKGKVVYSWDDIAPGFFWQAVLNLLQKEGLVIQEVESGVSGDDCLKPITLDSIEKIMKMEMLYGGDK